MSVMVRISGLRGYLELMARLHADPAPLLAQYDLPATTWQDEDALIPVEIVGPLLEASARLTRCTDFGLRLAALQDISILGPLAVAIQHSNTVADALAVLSHYLYVHSPALALSVLPDCPAPGQTELRCEFRAPRDAPQAQVLEQCLGVLHLILKLLAGPRYTALGLHLPHTPAAPKQAYRQFFNAPVLAQQPFGALIVPSTLLDVLLDDSHAPLRRMALSYLEQNYRNPGQSVTSRVRLAVSRSLATTGGSKTAVAEMLGMHPRTLQRRLLEERQHFESIRDDVRRELASRYLQQTRMSLTQLADVLGLSEQSALTRACKRWFGQTPTQLRRHRPLAAEPAP